MYVKILVVGIEGIQYNAHYLDFSSYLLSTIMHFLDLNMQGY